MDARPFRDRRNAGRELASALVRWRDEAPIVIGLPRGGVPVAEEVARALDAPLDVWVVRKIGAPTQPELGLGAVAEGGEVYLDRRMVAAVAASDAEVAALLERKKVEVVDRVRRFRGGAPPLEVSGRVVIVVDDGLATGGTARAALRALRRRGPKALVLAVPVGSPRTLEALRSEADAIVCPHPVEHMGAIGLWYDDFTPTSDEEVGEILDRAKGGGRPRPLLGRDDVELVFDETTLYGDLAISADARAIVLFAHGSGSSRRSPRNRFVAAHLQRDGVATFLLDLLTEGEDAAGARTSSPRFDIALLAKRLIAVTDWVRARPEMRHLAIGYFGASTGAAAALVAAASRADAVRAVVSRGGRPDLAEDHLANVRAPTLLIVGGADTTVLGLNRQALKRLTAPRELVVVPGATHLFEEPGALEEVARLASAWFLRHLVPGAAHRLQEREAWP